MKSLKTLANHTSQRNFGSVRHSNIRCMAYIMRIWAVRQVWHGDNMERVTQPENLLWRSCLGSFLSYSVLSAFCGVISTSIDRKDKKKAPEPVLEPPRYILQIPHPTSSRCFSALGFLTPLVWAQFSGRVSTLCTSYITNCPLVRGGRWNGTNRLLCWRWKARFPQRRQSVWDLVCLLLYGKAHSQNQ